MAACPPFSPRLDPILWTCPHGETTTATWTARRRHRYRVSFRYDGNCALWPRKPRWEKWPTANCAQRGSGADITISDSASRSGQISRKSAPKWRGPAFFLDIDESGVVGQFRSQTIEIERYCLRKRAVSIPGAQIGLRGMEGEDAPTSVEEPPAPEPRIASADVMSSVEVDFGSPKRP